MDSLRRYLALVTIMALVGLSAGCTGLALPDVWHAEASPEPDLPGMQTSPHPAPLPAPLALPTLVSSVPTPTPQPTATPGASGLHVPILMYHHLQDLTPRASPLMRSLTVSPRQFDDEMAYLAANGYHTVSFADLVAALNEGKRLPENPVILTFDDAWEQGYAVAYPILQKYRMTGTFFVPTSWMGQVKTALTWAQIEEMDRAGMEFGSHSITHPWFTRQRPGAVKHELEQSKATLEAHLGHAVVAHAYPFGAYNQGIAEKARQAGYGAAVLAQPNGPTTQERLFSLAALAFPTG